MSVQKEKQVVPATEIEVTISVTCDLCGKVAPRARAQSDGETDWPDDRSDVRKTYLAICSGYSYPECADLQYRAYHVCPECFEGKVEPWLQSLGAKPTENRIEW